MHAAHRLLCALGLAAISASSFATTTVYTSSSAFMANVVAGAYTNTFTSLMDPPPSSYSGNGFAYSISAPVALYTEGSFLSTNFPDAPLTITFSGAPVTAIGANFYAVDLSDQFYPATMSISLSDGTSVAYSPTSADGYRGFTSTVGITSLVIGASGQSPYVTLDNLTVGVAAVPEPTSLALMALGITGLLVARRRQA